MSSSSNPPGAHSRIRRIFLLDGIGALATFTLLFVVLGRLPIDTGMPDRILVALAVAAACFAAYSLACLLLARRHPRPYLTVIIVANALYGALTIVLVVMHLDTLSPWVIAYFAVELVVLGALIAAELRVRASLVARAPLEA